MEIQERVIESNNATQKSIQDLAQVMATRQAEPASTSELTSAVLAMIAQKL